MHIFFYLFIFTEYLGILLGITNHIANGRRRLGTKETVHEREREQGGVRESGAASFGHGKWHLGDLTNSLLMRVLCAGDAAC